MTDISPDLTMDVVVYVSKASVNTIGEEVRRSDHITQNDEILTRVLLRRRSPSSISLISLSTALLRKSRPSAEYSGSLVLTVRSEPYHGGGCRKCGESGADSGNGNERLKKSVTRESRLSISQSVPILMFKLRNGKGGRIRRSSRS